MVMGGGVAGLPLARQSTRPWLFRSAVVVIETLRGIPMVRVSLCHWIDRQNL